MSDQGAGLLLTATQARDLRAAATRILAIVPDPDASIHALDTFERTLCRSTGDNLRVTVTPALVSCRRCRHRDDWESWAWARGDGEGL